MSNVIDLKKARKQARQKRAEGKTLCGAGLHKWELLAGRRFDVKQGRLVSTERCKRCGEQRVKLT
jgi:hypothetical protein